MSYRNYKTGIYCLLFAVWIYISFKKDWRVIESIYSKPLSCELLFPCWKRWRLEQICCRGPIWKPSACLIRLTFSWNTEVTPLPLWIGIKWVLRWCVLNFSVVIWWKAILNNTASLGALRWNENMCDCVLAKKCKGSNPFYFTLF